MHHPLSISVARNTTHGFLFKGSLVFLCLKGPVTNKRPIEGYVKRMRATGWKSRGAIAGSPENVYEAAQVDGASIRQTFLHITFQIREVPPTPLPRCPCWISLRYSGTPGW